VKKEKNDVVLYIFCSVERQAHTKEVVHSVPKPVNSGIKE